MVDILTVARLSFYGGYVYANVMTSILVSDGWDSFQVSDIGMMAQGGFFEPSNSIGGIGFLGIEHESDSSNMPSLTLGMDTSATDGINSFGAINDMGGGPSLLVCSILGKIEASTDIFLKF